MTERTCVSSIHEQADTVVDEVGKQWGTVTRSVTCTMEAVEHRHVDRSELSPRFYAQLCFDRGVVHERFNPVEFFVTEVVPHARLADIVWVQPPFYGRRESAFRVSYVARTRPT